MQRKQYEPPSYGVAAMSAREILAENLTSLMSASKRYNSTTAIERATEANGQKVGHSTIDRALKNETNLSIEKIEAIARVFGLDAWQLMSPGLRPGTPPALKSVSDSEEVMYKRIGVLAAEIVEIQKHAEKESS